MSKETILALLTEYDYMTIKQIAKTTNNSRRTIERFLSELRENGHPIVSICVGKEKGMRLAKSKKEMTAWLNQMYSRINKMFKKCKKLKDKFDDESTQLNLFKTESLEDWANNSYLKRTNPNKRSGIKK